MLGSLIVVTIYTYLGLSFDQAMDKAKNVLPKIKPEDLADDIEDGIRDYQSRGITSATEMCVALLNGINDWHASLKYLGRPQLFRTRFAIDYKLLFDGPAFEGGTGDTIKKKLETLSKGFATLGGAKFFNDGSIQIHTAALRENYYDGRHRMKHSSQTRN